ITHVFKPIGYTGLACFLLTALRVPWVLDVDDWEGRGGWADVNPYSPAQKLSITLMEASLPRMARAVTTASRTLEARAWDMGIPRSRVSYLPNGVSHEKYGSWADHARPVAHAQNDLRASLGLGDSPTMLLYTRFDVFPLEWPLIVLRRLLAEHPDARLLVVGS